jgi:hypothetical protein
MPQEKVQVSALQEYPGSYVWRDYAIRCPECKELSTDYGDVETLIGEEWFHLCKSCGEKAMADEDEVTRVSLRP